MRQTSNSKTLNAMKEIEKCVLNRSTLSERFNTEESPIEMCFRHQHPFNSSELTPPILELDQELINNLDLAMREQDKLMEDLEAEENAPQSTITNASDIIQIVEEEVDWRGDYSKFLGLYNLYIDLHSIYNCLEIPPELMDEEKIKQTFSSKFSVAYWTSKSLEPDQLWEALKSPLQQYIFLFKDSALTEFNVHHNNNLLQNNPITHESLALLLQCEEQKKLIDLAALKLEDLYSGESQILINIGNFIIHKDTNLQTKENILTVLIENDYILEFICQHLLNQIKIEGIEDKQNLDLIIKVRELMLKSQINSDSENYIETDPLYNMLGCLQMIMLYINKEDKHYEQEVAGSAIVDLEEMLDKFYSVQESHYFKSTETLKIETKNLQEKVMLLVQMNNQLNSYKHYSTTNSQYTNAAMDALIEAIKIYGQEYKKQAVKDLFFEPIKEERHESESGDSNSSQQEEEKKQQSASCDKQDKASDLEYFNIFDTKKEEKQVQSDGKDDDDSDALFDNFADDLDELRGKQQRLKDDYEEPETEEEKSVKLIVPIKQTSDLPTELKLEMFNPEDQPYTNKYLPPHEDDFLIRKEKVQDDLDNSGGINGTVAYYGDGIVGDSKSDELIGDHYAEFN